MTGQPTGAPQKPGSGPKTPPDIKLYRDAEGRKRLTVEGADLEAVGVDLLVVSVVRKGQQDG